MTTLAEDIAALMALGHNLERATELAQADRAQADHARDWDWWAKRYDGYIDLLFTVCIGELKFFGQDEIATQVFWIHWVTKLIAKNGKLWFNDLRTRDPVRAFVLIWLVVFGSFNYYHIYRNAGV